jgi:hypothetical protein
VFRRFTIRSRFAAILALLFVAASMHAATLTLVPDCSLSSNRLHCELLGVLNMLYDVAGILGFILVIVIVLAIRSFRKNQDGDL